MKNEKFFDGSTVEDVLENFIQYSQKRLFPEGAPSLPTELPLSGSDATETALGSPLGSIGFKEIPLHVPVGFGDNPRHAYKSEVVLVRDPGVQTVKMMWWHDRDPRPEPHSHPWNFRSAIMRGGYTEERFWIDEHGELQKEVCTYEAGQINVMPANVFHTVTRVLPGTVTMLHCGPAAKGNAWGYLNTDNGQYIDQKELAAPDFFRHLVEINPHKAPKPAPKNEGELAPAAQMAGAST